MCQLWAIRNHAVLNGRRAARHKYCPGLSRWRAVEQAVALETPFSRRTGGLGAARKRSFLTLAVLESLSSSRCYILRRYPYRPSQFVQKSDDAAQFQRSVTIQYISFLSSAEYVDKSNVYGIPAVPINHPPSQVYMIVDTHVSDRYQGPVDCGSTQAESSRRENSKIGSY
nr:hypothetical protein CFP56_02548 [Quercus suber]